METIKFKEMVQANSQETLVRVLKKYSYYFEPINEYENELHSLYEAPRQYGIAQNHKHLPEMKKVCGLEYAPCFCPFVANFAQGMEVSVTLFKEDYMI